MLKEPVFLRSLSLKTKITGLVLLLFLCSIWVLTFFISKRLEHEMTAQLETQQFSTATYIANSIEGQARLRINALTAVADKITPELIANPAKLRGYLHERILLATLFQTACVVISREGVGIADDPVLPGRKGGSHLGLEYFKEVAATRKPAVGMPRVGRFSNKPVISFAVPVLNSSGRLIAVLAGHTLLSDPALLGSIENSAYKDFPDRLALYSPKYRLVITGSDPARIMSPTQKSGVNPLFDRFMSGFEGSGVYVNSRGISLLVSARQIPTPGWFIRVALPVKIAFAPIRSMKSWAYSMALGLSLVSSLFVWLIIRQALRPLSSASRLISDITEDRLPPQDIPVIHQDEVGQLLTSFNLHLNFRKKAEEAFKRVSHQNELILNAAGEGICGMDSEGKIMFANPEAADMCGYQVKELLGAHIHGLLHYARPDGSLYPQEECPHFSTLRQGTTCQMRDEVFWRKDGSSFSVAYTSTPILESDKIIGAVVTFRDITERKGLEETLRKSEEEYRGLFEDSKDVVFISTPEGRFIDINRSGVELFGYSSKEEILEVDIERDLYVHLGYRKELLKILDEQGYVKDYELLMKNKKGDIMIVLETATAFRNEMGVTSYRGILRDITHQRKLEQQLTQAQKMEAVGQLAGGIAHDFNNFLTAVIGYGCLLQMGMGEDNPLSTHVEQILLSTEKAANLTKQLLVFSRKQAMDRKPVKINQIILGIEKLLSRLIVEDVELKLTLSPDDPTVRADTGQIEQVLMNLATNARDAMPNGGMLTINTESAFMDAEFMKIHGYDWKGPYVIVTVSDTGEGMDEKTRKRIFEPFFTTKESGKGTGLGLAMVYGIVEQHNGHINVYSEPGEGTSFRIFLPLIEEAVEVNMALIKESASTGGTETILLAEDDKEVREMVRGLLKDFGYAVIEAADGDDALERFMEHKDRIELVILDVIMPKKNGKEVYNEVIRIKPGIKAIFTSGYPADLVHRKGIIEGGLAFISKPFGPNELLRTIRKVLQQ